MLLDHMVTLNLVSVKRLRSFVFKCQSVAVLLFTRCPFVHMMYAVLVSESIGGAAAGDRWVRQIIGPAKWIQ